MLTSLAVFHVGSQVPLQRTNIQVPFDQEIAGVQFVLRSDDKTRWWKDGSGNYFVPIPGNAYDSIVDFCSWIAMIYEFSQRNFRNEFTDPEYINYQHISTSVKMYAVLLDLYQQGFTSLGRSFYLLAQKTDG